MYILYLIETFFQIVFINSETNLENYIFDLVKYFQTELFKLMAYNIV
jgi:hypothetical protein